MLYSVAAASSSSSHRDTMAFCRARMYRLMPANCLRRLLRRRFQFGGGHDAVNQADLPGFAGGDGFPGEQHTAGAAQPHGGRQQRRFNHRGQPDAHFGQTENGVIGGDADVAGQRQLQGAAQAGAAYGDDDGQGGVEQAAGGVMQRPDERLGGGRRQVFHLMQVNAGRKGAFPGAAQDDSAQGVIGAALLNPFPQVVKNRRPQQVEMGPPLQGQDGNGIPPFQRYAGGHIILRQSVRPVPIRQLAGSKQAAGGGF